MTNFFKNKDMNTTKALQTKQALWMDEFMILGEGKKLRN